MRTTTSGSRASSGLVALGLVPALLGVGCSDIRRSEPTPVVLPSGEEVDLAVLDGVAEGVVSGFDATISGSAEEADLLHQFVTGVVPVAAERGAAVLVLAINDRSSTDVEVLGHGSYDFDTDNPTVIEERTPVATQQLVDEITSGLGDLTRTEESDPIGFFFVASQLLQQVEGRGTIVLLGDAISSIARCNVFTFFGPDGPVRPIEDLADECLAGRVLDLEGVEVVVIAGGVDTDGSLDGVIADGSRELLTEIVEGAGGHLRWIPVAMAGVLE